jgi:solute carrier family 13 (sodium-dependent dicarboxylate transporter), member 2/3/5
LPTSSGPALLTWKYAEARTPWNLIFLLGGGFAIAEGGSASGMSKQIGDALSQFQNLHPIVILIIVAVFCKVLTEFSTNTSVANITLPILANLSKNFNICPMYLMLPITVICSFAFHFPVGTPPNAIAAAKVNIQNVDMMIAGIGPSVITFFCCVFLLPFWSALIFPAEFDPFGYPNCGI